MTPKDFVFETILNNEALLALDLRMPVGVPEPIKHRFSNALVVGDRHGYSCGSSTVSCGGAMSPTFGTAQRRPELAGFLGDFLPL